MKIKLGELVGKKDALNYLLEQSIPVFASFKLSKAARLIQTELTEYDKVRNDLVKKYGKEDKKSEQVEIKQGSKEYDEFIKELGPVLEAEIELSIDQIEIKELGEKFEIEPKKLEPLVGFVIKE